MFTGIKGLELGFEKVGVKFLFYVECDPYCQAIIRKHDPEAVIYDDAAKVDYRKLPRVNILTGGFPCQDISNAGGRVGITGSRSSQWKHYLRAISEIRPDYALIENVSALTRRGLDVVLCDLASIGYDAEWHCISAASVGAFHRRQRIFILAYPHQERLMDTRIKEQSNKAKQQAQRDDSLPVSWATRADVCRASDGLPFGVHRIAVLGNAVVPKCAEIFAKAIKEREESIEVLGGRD